MKKSIAVLVLIALVFSVFAIQETFNITNNEYIQTYALCRAAGIETKQLVSPVSADQLLEVLQSIPQNRLNASEKEIYEKLVNRLNNPYMVYENEGTGFDLLVTGSPDLFFHTAVDEEVLLRETVEQRRDVLSVFEVAGKVYGGPYVYGFFDFAQSPRYIERNKMFSINYDMDFLRSEYNTPYKAFVSVGNKGFNFIIGRDRLSFGRGQTGNLMLGDNFLFEDFAKLSYMKGLFSYDMTLITFDNNTSFDDNPLRLEDEFNYIDPHQLVVIHQLSFNPVKWLNFSVSEGMLQYGSNLTGDLSLINPFMVLHNINSYSNGNANNFFGIDLSLTPMKNLQFNMTLFFDQIQQKQELNNGKPWYNTPPNANAYLLNAVYSKAVFGGMADFYVEGVYTNPAVYLKENTTYYSDRERHESYNYWDVDLIVGNGLSDETESDISYLGYKYGPDTIAFGTGFKYAHESDLQIAFETLFKVHGIKGIEYYENQQDYNKVGPDYYYLKTPTYTEGETLPEYRLSLTTAAKYSPFDWLTVKTECGFIRAWNYHNNPKADFRDLQVALGFTINPVHAAKNIIVNKLAK